MDLKTKQKLSKKRRFIIKRLQGLNILPEDKDQMNPTQQEIYNNIWSFDFTYWEQVKKEHGWEVREKLTEDEKYLKEKKSRMRSYLREHGAIPAYGNQLTTEQQKIIDDIDNNDFTFFEQFKRDLRKERKMNSNTEQG
jgi:hypothetical protein